ncbi:DUF58 domain-containing protein [soil metagenome]
MPRVTALPALVLLLAVLLRRPDLLYVAAPLALAAALALVRRPSGSPKAEFGVSDEVPAEGADLRAQVTVRGPDVMELVSVAIACPDWVRPPDRGGAAWVGLPQAGALTVGMPIRALRWGRQRVGPAVLTATAAGGLLRHGPRQLPVVSVRVLPLSERYDATVDVPQAPGVLGVHRSRRPGDGSELSGIRPFSTGDRLRRINWRVSLRTGDLHVNATLSERDAEVVLLLDARYDAGGSQGITGQASGLDVGVRATAALARCYRRLGDRVGLVAHGERVRQVRSAAGRGQLFRLTAELLDVAAPQVRVGEPELVSPVGLDPRALIVALSPLVGESVFARAAALARAGHPVVVVDTLPADAGPAEQTEWTALALRLWRLRRADRIHRLGELGVPVVEWRGAGSLDAVLRDLARFSTVPRVRR